VLRRPKWNNARVSQLAITVVGHDRPGIIARAAEILAASGMNLEDSSMTLLRGHFAMTLICAGESSTSEIESALQPLID
jgi:glycine cleavage system transcriptional repressor